MYLSRITLYTAQLSPSQLLHLVDRGEYVMHQWLWELFPGGKERQFLYRREELQGAFRFFVLSQERPAESALFDVQCRSFSPALSIGQTLRFNLRANPTICKAGRVSGLHYAGAGNASLSCRSAAGINGWNAAGVGR